MHVGKEWEEILLAKTVNAHQLYSDANGQVISRGGLSN